MGDKSSLTSFGTAVLCAWTKTMPWGLWRHRAPLNIHGRQRKRSLEFTDTSDIADLHPWLLYSFDFVSHRLEVQHRNPLQQCRHIWGLCICSSLHPVKVDLNHP